MPLELEEPLPLLLLLDPESEPELLDEDDGDLLRAMASAVAVDARQQPGQLLVSPADAVKLLLQAAMAA